MATTARLINDDNYSFSEPWAQSSSVSQVHMQDSKPKGKSVPSHDQYELLEPSSKARPQRRNLNMAANPAMSYLPTRRSGGWLWEALSFTVAVFCFAAVVGTLLGLQNRQVPDWPSGISVNAILSVIVTVMKGAMGVCIAECLSQIKWSWFKQERKLIDLVIIDEASRGIWGAGRLLLTLRAWYLAYVGAFIFLTAFLIGPTVQQMVEVRIRQVDLPLNATIPICNNSYYEVIGLGAGAGLNRVNLPMIGAMYDGFLQTSSLSPLRPGCPTGNCTYPRYQSLGICHECTDFSDQLVYLDDETNLTIPLSSKSTCSQSAVGCKVQWPGAALSLAWNYGMINSTQDYSGEVDSSLESSDNTTITTFRAVMSRNWQRSELDPVAVQCIVRFCVKTYEASVKASNFEEDVVATSWNESYFDSNSYFTFQNNLSIPTRPCYVNGIEKPEPWNIEDRTSCVYNVSGQSGISLYNTLSGLTRGDGSAIVSNRPSLSSDVMQALYGLFDGNSLADPDLGSYISVDRAFKSMADVVTNQARSSTANCGGATAQGVQFINELYIHVHWIWLLPTTVVLALCLVFFLATIVQSWREDLWKSSPLAYIFCRPAVGDAQLTAEDLITSGGLGAMPKSSTIEKASRNIEVRFERNIGSSG
ncbi:hypothetical protein LTR70_008906 [Exophiala xenobiotica]|uniref:Uncharacterized protein n=1 Tax=Lithohypha guttulata TaxID=1690604 RepID=A0ABR0JZE1_9EURO|nr:hypothetical protein LTR24_008899 [Lithohypha guttulata]KAK5311267.1 hypothetical protein LTR70_008906 [Exophiala xenobiotica]